MVIPSLLAHAANGQWCVTVEELQRLQVLAARAYERADFGNGLTRTAAAPPPPFATAGQVAIVPINGVLGKNLDWYDRNTGGVDYDEICSALDAAEADPATKIVCLDIRSPGGMVLGLPECADRIAAISKHTVAYTDYCMASAAYWLGAQCDAVYSSGSAMVGNIGVLATFMDVSKALTEMGFKVNAFSAGKWKLAGASFRPMTDEERAMFQGRVERAYGQFTAAVTRNRELPQECMEGQCFDGEQAAAAGLTDGIFPSLDDLLVHLHAPESGLTSQQG